MYKFVVQKYYIKDYIKEYNVYFVLKTVQHKLYSNLLFLLIFTFCWKDLLINFVNRLPILTDEKKNSYNSIFIIINWITKMVYYKPVNVTINTLNWAKDIINMIIRYHSLLNSIVTNQKLLFSLKFWLWICYFLNIKQKLFTTLHL